MVRDSIASDYPSRAELEATGARDVAPGECWAFRDHRTQEQVMALHIQDLDYLRAGWQKVVDNGQYGRTIYVFKVGNQLQAVTNKASGVGELVETITAKTPLVVEPATNTHGFNRSEPANFGVNYEGIGEKL